MSSWLLATREASIAYELRGAWAGGWEVVLVLNAGGRVRCRVITVATSDAFAIAWTVDGELHVPLGLVAAVRRPHFHEDSGPAVDPPPKREAIVLPLPGQAALFVADDERPGRWVDPQSGRRMRAMRRRRRRRVDPDG